MSLRDTWYVFRKEFLSQMRDRSTLIYVVVLPIFLYPAMFWGMNQLSALREGAIERETSRVVLISDQPLPELEEELRSAERVELRVVSPAEAPELDPESTDLLVWLRYLDADPERYCLELQLEYDGADDRSKAAKDRVESRLKELREETLVALYRSRFGVAPVEPLVRAVSVNLASNTEMSTFLIGLFAPMMIIIMVAMGTLYPALDTVVGERERETLETTLLAPVSRESILLGKFAFVVFAGVLAAMLNLASLAVLARHTMFGFLLDQGAEIEIPAPAVPLILVATVLIAVFYAAVVMVIAGFARTFREGQSFVTPFWTLSFQPAVVVALPGIELNHFTAWIPVANVALMFRAAISNRFDPVLITIVMGSLVLYCLPPLWLGSRMLRSESIFLGVTDKSVWRNIRAFFAAQRRGSTAAPATPGGEGGA